MNRLALLAISSAAAFACGGGDVPPQTPPPPPVTAPAPSVADLIVAPTASVAPPAPPSLSAFDSTALDSRKAEETARSLAQEVGPRLAGSAGDKLAVAWAVKTMTAAGLSNVHAEPVMAPVWKRGAESAEIVSPIHQTLAITALGWSGATPKAGVSGEVIEVTSLEALTKLPKGSAKGKIIFGNVVMKKSIDGKGYGDAVPMRLAGPKAAMDAGALAFVLRTVGTSEDRRRSARHDRRRAAPHDTHETP
jgi:carboxypeptidase Q